MNTGQPLTANVQPKDVVISSSPSAAMLQPQTTLNSTGYPLNYSQPFPVHKGNNSLGFSANQTTTHFYNNLNSLGHSRLDSTTIETTSVDQLQAAEQFYLSYNPQIGLHTASVLGGILGWLIVYLLYKTKVKKWVVKVVRKKFKKHKERYEDKGGACEPLGVGGDNDECNQQYSVSLSPNHRQPELAQCIDQQYTQLGQAQGMVYDPWESLQKEPVLDKVSAGQCPMPSIVVESYPNPETKPPKVFKHRRKHSSKSRKSKETLHRSQDKSKIAKKRKSNERSKHRKRNSSYQRACPGVTVQDVDEIDTKTFLLPPNSETDSAQATARWVQNMPLIVQSYQDFTGLILKVQSSMMGTHKPRSCPLISAALQYAALPILGLPNLGWNKSMPVLTENGASSLKNIELDSVFSDEVGSLKLDSKTLLLPPPLQPLKALTPPPARSRSSMSHCPPSKPPPPKLTISIPKPDNDASSLNLAIPGATCRLNVTEATSVPTSPVPIPVTPTVTITNFTSRVCGNRPRHLHEGSDDSFSSNSSFDPLLQPQVCYSVPYASRSCGQTRASCGQLPGDLVAVHDQRSSMRRSSSAGECRETGNVVRFPDTIISIETNL